MYFHLLKKKKKKNIDDIWVYLLSENGRVFKVVFLSSKYDGIVAEFWKRAVGFKGGGLVRVISILVK